MLFGRDPSVARPALSLDRQPGHPRRRHGRAVRVSAARRLQSNAEFRRALACPIAFTPFERGRFGSMYNNTLIARLKPGVSVEQARGELGVARDDAGRALSADPRVGRVAAVAADVARSPTRSSARAAA